MANNLLGNIQSLVQSAYAKLGYPHMGIAPGFPPNGQIPVDPNSSMGKYLPTINDNKRAIAAPTALYINNKAIGSSATTGPTNPNFPAYQNAVSSGWDNFLQTHPGFGANPVPRVADLTPPDNINSFPFAPKLPNGTIKGTIGKTQVPTAKRFLQVKGKK